MGRQGNRLETAPVTPPRLHDVLARLWPRGEEELRRLGLDKQQAFNRFMGYALGGPRSGIALDRGRPVLASGVARENGELFTWFIATDDFDDHASAITRLMRRQTHDLPGLRIYSVCVHPDTARWFHVLGFDRDEWEGVTPVGYPLFRFTRR